MSDPYRSTCSKCPELVQKIELQTEEIITLKSVNSSIKKNKMKDNFLRILFIIGCFCCTIILASFAFGLAKRPPEPETCNETIEIISVKNSVRTCSSDSKMTIEKLSSGESAHVLVRCLCPPFSENVVESK